MPRPTPYHRFTRRNALPLLALLGSLGACGGRSTDTKAPSDDAIVDHFSDFADACALLASCGHIVETASECASHSPDPREVRQIVDRAPFSQAQLDACGSAKQTLATCFLGLECAVVDDFYTWSDLCLEVPDPCQDNPCVREIVQDHTACAAIDRFIQSALDQ